MDLARGHESINNLSGPVGIVAAIGQAVSIDWETLFSLLALITINLGIFNLLPLPALDGGRLVFLIVEAIRRKPVPPEKEGMVHAIGLMLFFLLALVLAWHDIVTYVIK